MESLGLLITLTLGGLGMFLVVLVVTFALAKVGTKVIPTADNKAGTRS